jgi:histidinol-phosphate aminotransferase
MTLLKADPEGLLAALAILREDVRAMTAYAIADPKGLVKLDAMENPYGVPEHLKAALGERLSEVALNRYPDPRANSLRAMISNRVRLEPGLDLLLGNGSDELINIIVLSCAKPGASIMTLGPSFVMYRAAARMARIGCIEVPLRPDFSLDFDQTLAEMQKHNPAVTFISYPNNPTGTLFDREQIETLIRAAEGLVVIDEAYEAFSPDSFLANVVHHPRLLVLRTFSKVGLAGIRLGYLIGATGLIAEFDKFRPPYNINVLTQACARFMIEHQEVLKEQADVLVAEREKLRAALSAMPGLEVFPSAANFLLFRVSSKTPAPAPALMGMLKERGILIKDMSTSHPLLADCLRVTVSTPDENLAFTRALADALSELR